MQLLVLTRTLLRPSVSVARPSCISHWEGETCQLTPAVYNAATRVSRLQWPTRRWPLFWMTALSDEGRNLQMAAVNDAVVTVFKEMCICASNYCLERGEHIARSEDQPAINIALDTLCQL